MHICRVILLTMKSSLHFSLRKVTGRENTFQVITLYFMTMIFTNTHRAWNEPLSNCKLNLMNRRWILLVDTDTWFLCVCSDDSDTCLTWPYAQDTTRLLQSIICTFLSKLCVPFLHHCPLDNFLVQGVKINTPHYLAKLEQVPQGTSTYTVIVSQLESLTTIYYTLRVCA